MQSSIDDVLQNRFGLASFRPWQREAIEAVVGDPGRALVVAPTGGGKSLTYQLPAAILEGTTLVISPLVALMEDQVRSLTQRGIPATFIASTLDASERFAREDAMARGEYALVYVAPERLGAGRFVDLVLRTKIALVAIDEAHCIAQWGHDFRPDYLRIGTLLERLKPPRILACTATATPDVRREILAQLGLQTDDPSAPKFCREVLRGFARPNLHLAARSVEGPRDARRELLDMLAQALGSPKEPKGGAIVYAATRKMTEQYAELLGREGWNAMAYHAGMDAESRTRAADRFAARKVDVVVATNAFGMGIDRPDIRAVVHVQPPSSIEAYYQEVGRAGRDGDEAFGLLLCSGADISLRRRLVTMDGSTEADPVAAARAWGLFRELLRYLDARTCRHDFVLRYFGDEHEVLGGCGHCDVCLAIDDGAEDSSRTEETTTAVKKALSAVARAQKRGGLVAIAEMLAGKDSERSRRFGFTALSTFGLLKDRSHEWIVALLRAVLAAGWIDLTTTEHPVPFLTRAGASVMKGETPARIALPAEPRPRQRGVRMRSNSSSSSGARPEVPPADAALFERLRVRRAEIARERKVPAYVVALDRTLIDMAAKKPKTPYELLEVFGMGPQRVEQYGAQFLDLLA